MADYKLSYFNSMGRAEMVRLLFAAAGKKYDDERLQGEQWAKFKPDTPMKAMPVLTVKGKGMLCQSGSIARFVAKKLGLYGSDAWEEAVIDECVECVNDTINDMVKFFFEKDEAKKAELKKAFVENSLPKLVDYLRLRLKGGKDGFIVGKKLSLADIAAFNFINQQIDGGETFFNDIKDIMAHYNKVKAVPGIAKWLETRPK